jgi:NADH:ubiquinone oxidoreductase subunit E
MKKILLIALCSMTTAWAQTGDEYVPKTQEQKVAQPATTPTAVAPHKITFYGGFSLHNRLLTG